MSDKDILRKKALEQRKFSHADDDGMAARLVASQIIMLPELDRLKKIACYYSMKDELDSAATLKALHAARFSITLPKIIGPAEPLEMRRWDMRTELVPGPFGTSEPVGEIEDPEVILAPLVAFDETGARLGHGGGYYDRTIKALRDKNPALVVVGMAYENQKLDRVPTESYDQPMDIVVTEKTTYRFK